LRSRRKLDLQQLEVIDSLFRERSLTKAAHALQTSQPFLSKVLARLRVHFEDPLFIRIGHRMEPTPRALELRDPVAAVLNQARSLEQEQLPFDPRKSDRTFTFCAVDGGAIKFLPRLVVSLNTEAPDIRLRMFNVDPEHVPDWLETGYVDFAIGSFPRLPKSIRRLPLWREKYVVVTKRRRGTGSRILTLKDFCAQRHVLVSTQGVGHENQTIERAIETKVPTQNVQWRVPTFGAAARLVAQIDAIATLPSSIANSLSDELGLEVLPAPISLPEIQISQYWHQRRNKEAAMRWMRNLLQKAFRPAR
jgi:DNA-binding transcriptional LysR family regulator